MTTYKEVQDQIKALQQKAATLKKQETGKAIEQIKKIMEEYDLTVADLSISMKGKTRKPIAPKYKDPATGKTWTGRGVRPVWLKGKNLNDYLIKK